MPALQVNASNLFKILQSSQGEWGGKVEPAMVTFVQIRQHDDQKTALALSILFFAGAIWPFDIGKIPILPGFLSPDRT